MIKMNCNFIHLYLLVASLCYVNAQINVTETYSHSATLRSGNIKLYWKFDSTHITFEVHGQTTGWVGIGFSPNGAMTGADIIVGWVKNGQVTVTDRHGTGNTFPPLDPEQNIDVLSGAEEGGWTMFKFRRQLAACENDYDREITANTQRLIWAYGATDPTGDDIIPSNYHGTDRGVESMYFLESPERPSEELPEGPEYKTFDIGVENFAIPSESTYYNCKLFKIPELTKKHHIVKVTPVITPGNEVNVHHMLVYQCGSVLANQSELGVSERCYSPNMQHFRTCTTVIASWAIGGGSILYPIEAGYSIGESGDPVYIQIEMHYDNPTVRGDIIDNSGLRFTYTDTLRTYDVGVLNMGNTISGTQHFLPPGAESFLSSGFCATECLAPRMEASGVENVKIYSVVLHSHLAGRELVLRHYRNGTELPYISYDFSYDFNYQEGRHLETPLMLQPTDTLRMDCVYNTKGYTQMIQGGLGTYEEMCLSFVSYYPKIDIGLCTTSAVEEQSWYYFGIEGVEQQGSGRFLQDFVVTAPERLANKTVLEVMSEFNWTEENIDKFSRDYIEMTQRQLCLPQNITDFKAYYIPSPKASPEYSLPNKTCEIDVAANNVTTTTAANDVTTAPEEATTTSSSLQIIANIDLLLFALALFGLLHSL